jgi:hypothetical protein
MEATNRTGGVHRWMEVSKIHPSSCLLPVPRGEVAPGGKW